ncbi:MAG: SCO family protein [Allosphingosinicella sp.]
MNETAKPRFLLLLSLLLGLLAAACSPAAAPPLEGAKMGGPFTLTAEDGRTVTEKDFAGRYRIVYFGFTHCPDICPTDLATIGQALRLFEEEHPKRAEKVQPLFVTVDPERDTPEQMARYTSSFHPRILGLTGTPEQIADAAKKHGIYYAKGEAQPGGGYPVDHTRVVVLYGTEGEPIALLPYEQGAEAVAAELARWVR